MSSSPGPTATARSEPLVRATSDRIAAALRGDPSAALFVGVSPAEVCHVAESQGVLGLLADALTSVERPSTDVADALGARARILAAADLAREGDLRRLLSAFGDAGIPAILFKGAALAYTHYPRPDLRPRLDTDVLITPADTSAGERLLAREGYEPVHQFSGDLVSYQQPYVKHAPAGVDHVVDLHWRLSNPQVFGQVLTHGELLADAEPLAALGPTVRIPGRVHALFLACVHRVAHHAGTNRLIWLYDIHLLVPRLTDADWDRFATVALDRGVATVCADGLRASAATFDTQVPDRILDDLSRGGSSEHRTARYLRPGRRHAETVANDFWAIPTWRERIRLVRQHALPSRQYMRDVYAPDSGSALPVLYVRRAVRGARRWLSRS